MRILSRKNLSVFLLGILVLLVLAGCGSAGSQVDNYDEEIWGKIPEEDKGIEVQTNYFTFEYPAEWENKVEEVRSEDGENTTVTFKTKISGKEVVLFSVTFGPDEVEGYLLGQLKEDEKMINVYTVVNEMPAEDWSEEEYNEICSLQERVNDIIMQVFDDERFIPAR